MVTPQVQLAHTSINSTNSPMGRGVDVPLNEGKSLKGRLSLALEFRLGGTCEWAGGKYAIHGEALGQTSFTGS